MKNRHKRKTSSVRGTDNYWKNKLIQHLCKTQIPHDLILIICSFLRCEGPEGLFGSIFYRDDGFLVINNSERPERHFFRVVGWTCAYKSVYIEWMPTQEIVDDWNYQDRISRRPDPKWIAVHPLPDKPIRARWAKGKESKIGRFLNMRTISAICPRTHKREEFHLIDDPKQWVVHLQYY